jgi:hypothetical protein
VWHRIEGHCRIDGSGHEGKTPEILLEFSCIKVHYEMNYDIMIDQNRGFVEGRPKFLQA